jgi:hypothetical protein
MLLNRPLSRRTMRHRGPVAAAVLGAAVDAAVLVVVTKVEVFAWCYPSLLSTLAFTEAAPAVGAPSFYFSLDLAA